MNNFRLTNYSKKKPAEIISNDEKNFLFKTSPLVEYLWDGRLRNIETKKIVNQHESSIYIVLNPKGEEVKFLTLSKTAAYVGCNIKTISKYLDVEFAADKTSYTAIVNCHKIKRVRVYSKSKKK